MTSYSFFNGNVLNFNRIIEQHAFSYPCNMSSKLWDIHLSSNSRIYFATGHDIADTSELMLLTWDMSCFKALISWHLILFSIAKCLSASLIFYINMHYPIYITYHMFNDRLWDIHLSRTFDFAIGHGIADTSILRLLANELLLNSCFIYDTGFWLVFHQF